MAEKKWLGAVGDCDLCQRSLKQFESFIDGRTVMGPWALMCPDCHKSKGVGLGTGCGQAYRTVDNVKIGG